MFRSFAASTSGAYLFLMVALLIGLPLLTAYQIVNPSFYSAILIPYLAVSVVIAMFIIRRSIGNPANVSRAGYGSPSAAASQQSTFISRFNSISPYFSMGLFTFMVVLFGAVRFLIDSHYPYPAPETPTDFLGAAYIVLLVIVSIFGFTKLIYSYFPILGRILAERKYALMVLIISVSFAFVYLLLVNQILIGGLNTTSNSLPSPGNVYPYAHVFTVGIQQPFLNLVYIPYAVVQFNPNVDLLIVPFEMIFTVFLSILVATNVVMAHYLISHSGLACSAKGAVLSTGGSIIGLTATCPTCLVPTFVSVIFGGIVAAEAVYSNIWGVVIPPVLSVVTLVLSVVYLSRKIKQNTGQFSIGLRQFAS